MHKNEITRTINSLIRCRFVRKNKNQDSNFFFLFVKVKRNKGKKTDFLTTF